MANLETRNKAKLLQNIHKQKIEFLIIVKNSRNSICIKTFYLFSNSTLPPCFWCVLWNTTIVDCHCLQIWSKHNLAILGTWQCGRVKPMCGNGDNIAKVPVTESPSGPGVKPGLPLPLSRGIREAMFRLRVFRELQQISSGPYRPAKAPLCFPNCQASNVN